MKEIDPNRQYILAGDISASMETVDCHGNTRYNYMIEKFEQFIKAATDFDPDGPTVILFGENIQTYYNITIDKVKDKLTRTNFEGWTNTNLAIDEAWNIHRQEKSELAKSGKVHTGTCLMIFTDGAPTNRISVANSILKIANAIDREREFSMIFITVGVVAPDLRTWLDMIDNGLVGAKYDIVSVKSIEEINFLGAVKSALTE